MQSIKIVHWESDGWRIGYLQDYPDYWTQGETLDELKENLRDIFRDICSGELQGLRKVEEMAVS